jgi:hypothetical protein
MRIEVRESPPSMARAELQRPHTFQQTARDQLAQIHLQTGGGPYISERTAAYFARFHVTVAVPPADAADT